MKYVCTCVVVEECEFTVVEMQTGLNTFIPTHWIEVVGGYYPKQRIIKVETPDVAALVMTYLRYERKMEVNL